MAHARELGGDGNEQQSVQLVRADDVERHQPTAPGLRVTALIEARPDSPDQRSQIVTLHRDVPIHELTAGTQHPDQRAIREREDADQRLVGAQQSLRRRDVDRRRRRELDVCRERRAQTPCRGVEIVLELSHRPLERDQPHRVPSIQRTPVLRDDLLPDRVAPTTEVLNLTRQAGRREIAGHRAGAHPRQRRLRRPATRLFSDEERMRRRRAGARIAHRLARDAREKRDVVVERDGG